MSFIWLVGYGSAYLIHQQFKWGKTLRQWTEHIDFGELIILTHLACICRAIEVEKSFGVATSLRRYRHICYIHMLEPNER